MTLQFPIPARLGQSVRHGATTWVWDGVGWHVNPKTAGLERMISTTAELTYILPAGEDTFALTSPDAFNRTYAFSASVSEPVALYLNGVRLVPDDGSGTGDYLRDVASNSVQLLEPLVHEAVVHIQILVGPEQLPRGTVLVHMLLDLDTDWAGDESTGLQDGVNARFPIYYTGPDSTPEAGHPASPAELSVYVDGVRQRPGLDYTVDAATLVMLTPPEATATFWALWYEPTADTGYSRIPQAAGSMPAVTAAVGDPDITYDLRRWFAGEHLSYSAATPATMDGDGYTARIVCDAEFSGIVTFTASSPHGPDALQTASITIAAGAAPTAPANTAAPTMSSPAQVGSPVSITAGTWDNAVALQRRVLSDATVRGNVTNAYSVVDADYGRTLTVQERAQDSGGVWTAWADVTSNAVAVDPITVQSPATLDAAPRIGTPAVGTAATYSGGTPSTVTSAFFVDGLSRGGSFTPGDADDGGALTYRTTPSVGPVSESAAQTVTYRAPTAGGGLANQSFTQNTGVRTYDASGDFNVAGDPDLSGVDWSLPTAPGGLTINLTGVVAVDTGSTGALTDAPVVVRATNSGGQADSGFNLSVIPAPTAADDALEVLTERSAQIDLLANDTDPEGGGLTIIAIGATTGGGSVTPAEAVPTNNGLVTYTAGTVSETDTFTYTIEDISGDQDTATVTVTVVAIDIADASGPVDATIAGLDPDVQTTITISDATVAAYNGTYVVDEVDLAAAPIVVVDPLILTGTLGGGVMTLGYGLVFFDADKGATTSLVLEARQGGPVIGSWTWDAVIQDSPSLDQDVAGVPDELRLIATDGAGDQTTVSVFLGAAGVGTDEIFRDLGDETFSDTGGETLADDA